MSTIKSPTAHTDLVQNPGGKLTSLWLEIGASCHLRCDYCFASCGGVDRDTDNLPRARILDLLDEFIQLGGTDFGLVGAGEPFVAQNSTDAFAVLDRLKNRGVTITVFTTADLLTDALIERLEAYRPILLIKCNSLQPVVQDHLVHLPGYTQRRNHVLETLIKRGWNDGRLGIVTSVMSTNQHEIPSLLRFARQNHLIFDADTLLGRGRGEACGLHPTDDEIKEVIRRCQKVDSEFGITWDVGGTYIASSPCTRFRCHLYIQKDGSVHPCVGSAGILLGNAKHQTLAEIWEGTVTKIIREHRYVGKCTTCAEYIEGKCFSCLGRACSNPTTEYIEQHGHVLTNGCLHYRK